MTRTTLGCCHVIKTLTIHDDPTGVPGAEDPKPADLEVIVEDYRLGAGDTVQIAIYELLERQAYAPFQRTISESGAIDLPVIGRIEGVVGMMERDLTNAIVDRLIQREILLDPFVDVALVDRQQQLFTISGGIQVVGQFPIPRKDYRLMDALIEAGDASPDPRGYLRPRGLRGFAGGGGASMPTSMVAGGFVLSRMLAGLPG